MSTPATSALTRLEGIAGAQHFITDASEIAAYEVDGLRPSAVVRPGSAEEVAEIVKFAATEHLAVIPCGGRTKLRIGMPPGKYDLALDLTRLDRVLAYDPGDLTLGVEPGIRYAALVETLAAQKQFLPLAPAFANRATIGGILGANSGTPLRHAYGSARDYVLGMEFVTGDGLLRKSGGRVVKNVTGYDMHKLMIGALGTLGIMTRINFRTFPLPPVERAFVAAFRASAQALAFCAEIRKSQLQPRIVEIVGPHAAQFLSAAGEGETPVSLSQDWSVVVAAAGNESVVERHARDLAPMAERAGATNFEALADAERESLLGRIREFPQQVLDASPGATILRINVLPAQMERLLERARAINERNNVPAAALVRASGVIYLALLCTIQNESILKRLAADIADLMETAAAPDTGGSAWIEWCPVELKREINVWGKPREDFPLMQRLKSVFDPAGILSPGRFVGGL